MNNPYCPGCRASKEYIHDLLDRYISLLALTEHHMSTIDFCKQMDVVIERLKTFAEYNGRGEYTLYLRKPIEPYRTPDIELNNEMPKEKVTKITIYYREVVE